MAYSNSKIAVYCREWRKRTAYDNYAIRAALLASAKHRAKVNKLPFNLTVEDVPLPSRCAVLNIKLKPKRNGTKGGGTKYSPSLDRIVSSRGYVRGNVQVISNLANTMKNSANKRNLISFANWVLRNYN